jgi:hypothetical protein
MEKNGRLMDEIPLENGLTLRFFDRSQRITGDRWRLELVASILIPRQAAIPPSEAGAHGDADAFFAACAGELRFEQEKVRYFVDERDMAPALDQMKREFIDAGRRYLSHAGFARRYFLKAYGEWRKREEVKKAQAAMIRDP